MTARVCLQSGRVRDSLGFPTPFFFKLLILCIVYHDELLDFKIRRRQVAASRRELGQQLAGQ